MSAPTSNMGPPAPPAKCPFLKDGCIAQRDEKPTWLQSSKSTEKPKDLDGLCTSCQQIHPRFLEKLARPLMDGEKKTRMLEAVSALEEAKAKRAHDNGGTHRYLCASQDPELADNPVSDIWKTHFAPNPDPDAHKDEPTEEDCPLVSRKYALCFLCRDYAIRKHKAEYLRFFESEDKGYWKFKCAMMDDRYASYSWRIELKRESQVPCGSVPGRGMLCTACELYSKEWMKAEHIVDELKSVRWKKFHRWFVRVDEDDVGIGSIQGVPLHNFHIPKPEFKPKFWRAAQGSKD